MRQTETRSKLLTAESRGAVRESPLMRARKRGAPDSAARALARSVSSEGAELSADGKSIARAETTNPAKKRTELAPLTQSEERLLKNLLSEPMDYIDHPEYHLPDAAERIYGAAEIARPDVTWYRPLMDDFISTRSRGTRTPKAQSTVLLTGAQERVLFMKYNFARFSISEIQKQAASRSLTLVEAREMLRWHAIANQYREQLAETNLALVLAMAKRVRLSEVDFADLIGEGNMALMRSVDKFDCGRGFKFSTYACRAILKAFSRHGIKVSTQKKRFGAEYDPALEKSNHLETVRATHERECADEVRHIVTSNKADLSDIEIKVISHRFGLDVELALEQGTSSVPAEPLTLEQVGQVIGVTKERVRQIQNKALEKIRTALQAVNPDAAGAMADDIAAREGRTPPSAN
ncbi:MAG: polymerase sigma factor SigA [Planctomycetota bacterium]|jgi:RNA polymerase primary sigma factor